MDAKEAAKQTLENFEKKNKEVCKNAKDMYKRIKKAVDNGISNTTIICNIEDMKAFEQDLVGNKYQIYSMVNQYNFGQIEVSWTYY